MPDWCVCGNRCWRTGFLLFSYKCDNAILLSDTDSQSADAPGASDNDATLLSDIRSDDSISSYNGVILLSITDSYGSDDSFTSDNDATLLSNTDSQTNDDSVTSHNDATLLSETELRMMMIPLPVTMAPIGSVIVKMKSHHLKMCHPGYVYCVIHYLA